MEHAVDDLKDKYIPEPLRSHFVFHATELFSGGKNLPRDQWPKDIRWKILENLVSIPRSISLPIVFGQFAAQQGSKLLHHKLAYSLCLIAGDRYIQDMAAKDEAATVIVEDNTQARKHIKQIHDDFKNPGRLTSMPPAFVSDNLPITRIKDTVFFASKQDAILLQLADACSFVLKRHLSQQSDSERFFHAMLGECPLDPNFLSTDIVYGVLVWRHRGELSSRFSGMNRRF